MGSPEKERLRSLEGVVSCVCTEQPHSGTCRTILDGHGRPVDDCSQRAGSCHDRPYADLSGYNIPLAVASQLANLPSTRHGALPAAARFSCACGVGKRRCSLKNVRAGGGGHRHHRTEDQDVPGRTLPPSLQMAGIGAFVRAGGAEPNWGEPSLVKGMVRPLSFLADLASSANLLGAELGSKGPIAGVARVLNPLAEPIARMEMAAHASGGADISVCRAG